MNKKQRTKQFIAHFSKNMPEAKTELDYSNSFELTIAVILSAQCTDKRVNIITKKLFKEKKEIYYHRYSGLINAIMGKSSWFRPKV